MAYLDKMELYKAYRILRVSPGDSVLTIKRAYRKLVRAFHPDRFASNPASKANAEEQMKIINEAYSLIKDAPLSQADIFRPKVSHPPTQKKSQYSPQSYYAYTQDWRKQPDLESKSSISSILMHFILGSLIGIIFLVLCICLIFAFGAMNMEEFPTVISIIGIVWKCKWLLIISCGLLAVVFKEKFYNFLIGIISFRLPR